MAHRDFRRGRPRRRSRRAFGADWHWEELPDTDWVAENQRSFRPFAVGPFWVHPSHVTDGMPAGLLPLRIDAGLAFGTGTHATTRGCLELLATLDPAETVNAVDVGCGSGILAIAMAKLWQRPVLGGDNDAEAVDVARENAELNGVGDLCRFVMSAGLQAPELAARAPYDLIVANILAGPLAELSESFAAAVQPGRPRAAERAAGRAGRTSSRPTAAAASPSSAASTSRPAAPGGARCCCARCEPTQRKGPAFAGPLYAYATLQTFYAARRKFWLAALTEAKSWLISGAMP